MAISSTYGQEVAKMRWVKDVLNRCKKYLFCSFLHNRKQTIVNFKKFNVVESMALQT